LSEGVFSFYGSGSFSAAVHIPGFAVQKSTASTRNISSAKKLLAAGIDGSFSEGCAYSGIRGTKKYSINPEYFICEKIPRCRD